MTAPPSGATGPVPQAAATDAALQPQTAGVLVSRPVLYALLVLVVLALGASLLLWQRLGHIEQQLARQSADSGAQAIEARALAREAQELARATAARQAVNESRLAEVAQQRTQLDDLMQSLSRSRDENLLVDIESSLRLAQQQAQLALSPEPLLAALRSTEQRLARAAQPRLARVRTAIQRDIERISAATVPDVPALLVRLDELARAADELPVANGVGPAFQMQTRREAPASEAPWWERALAVLHEEARALVRVSRIEAPEAALVSPDQAFFLRENLKLKLLNARLSLLARLPDLARADLASAQQSVQRYFSAGRRSQSMATSLQQLQVQLRSVEMPRIDETLALLDATAAGR
ncbi:uroporphyrinogen-III C-methyltransferase [Ramlibacter sp. AW1]|uniref:Uroporphyrinogen-III C-methyltransferase n=1 Tax=Ramlibacter aurantiacus TaxID=2801330 RepID=A0A936ZTC7_9BURK|nr:uroporphyrinogen-III C-methyltransferase [Ramlibacter aurantiacus]MBL0423108.1 uroporphyrinogen-III C-methyltransferase [Ramlibacter aurantiacus]